MANKRITALTETIDATDGYVAIDKGGLEALKISKTNLLSMGISLAQVDTPLAPQSVGTTYAQVQVTERVVYQSDTSIINVTYPGGKDSILFSRSGIYIANFTLYVEGTNNLLLNLKTYKNGVGISAGDPIGVNLLGAGKPVAIPFSGGLNLTEGDVLTFYAKGDVSGTFTINSGNYFFQKTPY